VDASYDADMGQGKQQSNGAVEVLGSLNASEVITTIRCESLLVDQKLHDLVQANSRMKK